MKVESIAECSHWSILQYFWPALSNIIGLENQYSAIFRLVLWHRFYCIVYFRLPVDTPFWINVNSVLIEVEIAMCANWQVKWLYKYLFLYISKCYLCSHCAVRAEFFFIFSVLFYDTPCGGQWIWVKVGVALRNPWNWPSVKARPIHQKKNTTHCILDNICMFLSSTI